MVGEWAFVSGWSRDSIAFRGQARVNTPILFLSLEISHLAGCIPPVLDHSTPIYLAIMHLLGHNLPDHKLIRVRTPSSPCRAFPVTCRTHPPSSDTQVALTSFHGISHHTSSRILARLQIHEQALVSGLTEPQITALSAFLSSPSNTATPAPTPICPPGAEPHGDWQGFPVVRESKGKARAVGGEDPLQDLKIETDLRRAVQSDIAHMRTIGTYKGRR